MKKILYITIFTVIATCFSCKKAFLDEVPVGFFNSSNGLVSYSDYNLAVNDLYRLVRTEFYSSNDANPFDYMFSTDIWFDGSPGTNHHTNMIAAFAPTGSITQTHWNALYQIVAEANTVITLVPNAKFTDAQKTGLLARAKFFRAFAYRTLAYLYGGVPLSLTQVTTPKTDYVRATKADVLNQCISDLKDAVAGLPAISAALPGEVNVQAAQHLLAEVYLAAGQPQDAINSATSVINSGVVSLMTKRFGSQSANSGGNVYWDLFQMGNQNRASGNMEGLWVIQFATDVPGGSASSTAQAGSYLLERVSAPYLTSIISTGGKNPFRWPTDAYGRGVGFGVSTKHFSDEIWQSDFNNDIRNSNIIFVRTFTSDNPASPFFGQKIQVSNPPPGVTVPSRAFYAYSAKCTPLGGHPAGLFDPTTGLLKSTAGGTYSDQYMFRLAETYLIRAEAYLALGNTVSAAADINTVRARSSASPVSPANVNIDYILDERLRELGTEEKRALTLMRLGLIYDRVKRFNPYYSDIDPRYNLWPIPFAEIQRNKDAVLTQNPGYN